MKRFNHLQQCLVLFGLCLLGAVIGELSPVSVPGSVVGMVMMLSANYVSRKYTDKGIW